MKAQIVLILFCTSFCVDLSWGQEQKSDKQGEFLQ